MKIVFSIACLFCLAVAIAIGSMVTWVPAAQVTPGMVSLLGCAVIFALLHADATHSERNRSDLFSRRQPGSNQTKRADLATGDHERDTNEE